MLFRPFSHFNSIVRFLFAAYYAFESVLSVKQGAVIRGDAYRILRGAPRKSGAII